MKSQKNYLIILLAASTLYTSSSNCSAKGIKSCSEDNISFSPTAILRSLLQTDSSLQKIAQSEDSPLRQMMKAEKKIEKNFELQKLVKDYSDIYTSMISTSSTYQTLKKSSDLPSPKTDHESLDSNSHESSQSGDSPKVHVTKTMIN